MGRGTSEQKNEIAVQGTQWLALQPDSDLREALQANIVAGETIDVSDLIRVPTPGGGGTTWTWQGISGEESDKEIVGILVCYQPRGVLWPSQEPGDSPPLLVTHDMIEAEMLGDNPGDIDLAELEKYRLPSGRFDWAAIPWNQWGSGKNGIGKRCKEQRLLFVLRQQDAWPMVVTAQPGSLKTIRPFIKRLTVPHWRAVVSLSLQKVKSKGGIDYAQIVPRLVATLSKEEGDMIRRLYTEPLKRVATRVQVDAGGDAAAVDDTAEEQAAMA